MSAHFKELCVNYELSSNLDWSRMEADFTDRRRIRLENFLTPDSARVLFRAMRDEVSYRQAYVDGRGNQEISAETFKALSPDQKRQLLNAVYGQAAQGVGFWYGRHGIGEKSPEPVRDFLNWFNSEEVFERIRRLPGAEDVRSASGQVSRFLPGDFLTRHIDDVGDEGRRVAYVMNLSPDWHPDWGGLLQFFHSDGRPREAWTPLYNSLCLFDVRHVHSVTCVAPFARHPRLAISGWFRRAPRSN
jgi:SM-20-related protein